VFWTAFAELFVTFVVGFLMNRGADARLLMGAGFACMAFACLLNAQLTTAWGAENYFRTEFLAAVGQSSAFVGLVGAIILQSVFSGGVLAPQSILTFSAFFHGVRLFGGQVGVVLMTHFITVREQFHSDILGFHVQGGNWIAESSINTLAAGLSSKSQNFAAATGRGLGILSDRIRLQAFTLSYIDGFYLIAWFCVLVLLTTACLRGFPLNYGDLTTIQQQPLARGWRMMKWIFWLAVYLSTSIANFAITQNSELRAKATCTSDHSTGGSTAYFETQSSRAHRGPSRK
jgi:DHA2 family multidrug resistance protein